MTTYYQQWKALARPYVAHYFTDVTVHDKRLLRAFSDCEFIGGMRETGTNIIVFDGDKRSDTNKSWSEAFTFNSNHRFFHGNAGVVHEIPKDKAMAIWREYRSTV